MSFVILFQEISLKNNKFKCDSIQPLCRDKDGQFYFDESFGNDEVYLDSYQGFVEKLKSGYIQKHIRNEDTFKLDQSFVCALSENNEGIGLTSMVVLSKDLIKKGTNFYS